MTKVWSPDQPSQAMSSPWPSWIISATTRCMNSNPDASNSAAVPSFEVALEQLQLMVKKLESGELSLDQALKSFEDGVKLTRVCQQYLAAAEQKIEVLTQASADGKIDLQPFTPNKS